jgi:hypothetical protein
MDALQTGFGMVPRSRSQPHRNRIATASATALTTSTTSGALGRAAGIQSRLNLEDLEHDLRSKLEALGPAVRAELFRVLMLPDFDRARRIGTSTPSRDRERSPSC